MDDIATWLRARAADETSNDTAAKFWGAANLIESHRSDNARLAKELEEARAMHFEEAAQVAYAVNSRGKSAVQLQIRIAAAIRHKGEIV